VIRISHDLCRHPGCVPRSTTIIRAMSQMPPRQRVVLGRPRHRAGVTVGIAAMLLIVMPAVAQSPLSPAALADTQLPDPRQEADAMALMYTLRCLVCQGQSIADSEVDMAGDMRALVRQRIAAGEPPEKVRAWLIERYGSYVTYDPPFGWTTAPLWLMPIALLALGGWVAMRTLKRRRRG
jgi:cytochrome c-type biogenesis protein CcmH